MKKLILPFLFFASNPIFAQYLGGNGRGEIRELVLTELLDGTTASATGIIFTISPINTMLPGTFSAAVQVVGSNNLRFNSSASIALAIGNNPGSGTLSGTTTVAASLGFAEFTGLSINNAGTGYTLTATSTGFSTSSSAFDIDGNRYAGGSGDGYANNSVLNTPAGGQKLWRGGTSKDWATASNWYPVGVPSSTDAISIENNSFTNNPILDGNRTVASVDFGGAAKKIEVGINTFTVTEKIFNADANNYVKTNGTGSLKRPSISNNETFTFPVGNSTYNPVTVSNKNTSSDSISVRVKDVTLKLGLSGDTIKTPHVQRTWVIKKSNPNVAGVDFVFEWNKSAEFGVMDGYYLNHNTGTNWELASFQTQPTVEILNDGTRVRLTLNDYMGGFSPFSIGNDPSSPLPVELLNFNALMSNRIVNLTWQTASEQNNDFFTVERSADGFDFEPILYKDGAGNSNTLLSYSDKDLQPLEGVSYYRLKQTDFDGAYEYSDIRVVSSATDAQILIYPNPSRGIILISASAPITNIKLIAADGRILEEHPSLNELKLELTSGIYHLQYVFNEKTYSKKIVIVN